MKERGERNKMEGAIERVRRRWSHQRCGVICIIGAEGGVTRCSAAFWLILYLMALNAMPIMAMPTRCTALRSILMVLKPPTTIMVAQLEHKAEAI